MPKETPIAASRFGLSVDGVQLARFEQLLLLASLNGEPRTATAHELSHVVQQGARPARRTAPFVLLRGLVASRTAMGRLQASTPLSGASVIAFDVTGRPESTVPLPAMKVLRLSAPMAKGGGEVAMEELLLGTEG